MAKLDINPRSSVLAMGALCAALSVLALMIAFAITDDANALTTDANWRVTIVKP